MEQRPTLGLVNFIRPGDRKASLKITAFAACEWIDERWNFWRTYEGCEIDSLYRIRIGSHWFWPRPGDRRFPFVTADEARVIVGNLLLESWGINSSEFNPEPCFDYRKKASYLCDDGVRNRAKPNTRPFLENDVWWIKVPGCRKPIPCSCVAKS